jgi:hypothetical protein
MKLGVQGLAKAREGVRPPVIAVCPGQSLSRIFSKEAAFSSEACNSASILTSCRSLLRSFSSIREASALHLRTAASIPAFSSSDNFSPSGRSSMCVTPFAKWPKAVVVGICVGVHYSQQLEVFSVSTVVNV